MFQCWVQDISVWFVFFVTLTCFPAIQAGIQRSSEKFFIPGRKPYTLVLTGTKLYKHLEDKDYMTLVSINIGSITHIGIPLLAFLRR